MKTLRQLRKFPKFLYGFSLLMINSLADEPEELWNDRRKRLSQWWQE